MRPRLQSMNRFTPSPTAHVAPLPTSRNLTSFSPFYAQEGAVPPFFSTERANSMEEKDKPRNRRYHHYGYMNHDPRQPPQDHFRGLGMPPQAEYGSNYAYSYGYQPYYAQDATQSSRPWRQQSFPSNPDGLLTHHEHGIDEFLPPPPPPPPPPPMVSHRQMEYCPPAVTPIRTPQGNHPSGAKVIKTSSSRPSSSSSVIWTLSENDIVCGRGAPTLFQRGNAMFRELVDEHQMVYLCSKRSDKPHIAWKIFDAVQARGGRFVRRNKLYKASTSAGMGVHDHDRAAHSPSSSSSFAWEELTDQQAYEKICQSLREGAPEMRRRMMQFKEHQRQGRSPHKSSQVEDDGENRKPSPVIRASTAEVRGDETKTDAEEKASV